MAKRSYTEEEVERGLTEYALAGADRELAHARLKLMGYTIPASTIQNWAKNNHADRYQRIRAEQASKIAERIANEAEDFALELSQAERDTLAAYRDEIGTDRGDKIASALRNLTTSKGLQVDRVSSPLRGRPTQIVEHRDASEIVRKLERLKVIEGTAEEIEDEAIALPPAD